MNNERPAIPGGCQEELVAGYEQLRRTVLGGRGLTDLAWGLTVHLREGTVSWMRAWPGRSSGGATAPVRAADAGGRVVTPAVHREVVVLLASMAASCCGEVAT